MNFYVGDKVLIKAECKTQGEMGWILAPLFDEKCCVKLDSGKTLYYSKSSLQKIENNKNFNDDTINTNKPIPYIVTLTPCTSGYRSKNYNFISYIEGIQVADYCVADTAAGYMFGKVVSTSPTTPNTTATREIICKCDFTDFIARKEKAQKIKEIEKKLDSALVNAQKMRLYERMAEDFPEIKDLLSEYKSLIG